MEGVELKEYLLSNGKLQWRAILNGSVIMVRPSRVELVRALRKRYNLGH